MYTISANTRAVTDADGTTILDLSSNQILALNDTGSFIWNELAAGRDVDGIVDGLLCAVSISRDLARQDVASFVDDLVTRGLLEQQAP